MYLIDLLESQDSRLARVVQRAGPRGTSSIEACTEMLAGLETRDVSYPQVANALLFLVFAQSAEPYDVGIFVEGLRQHRAGSKIDWTDVVQGLDKDLLRVSKPQFLALYNALLPLTREYANFDVQSLWSGQWQYPETQLSFVVAFLSTQPHELDVTKIPNLRQAFTVEDFESGSDQVKAFAAEAVKHPLVSRDATEALFTMIFRSQETYNLAQMLGIPDSIINPNMTIFVCAASAVPKPWEPLQDQALKQLFYPFLLRQHDNYQFVMHSLWMHDKLWVAARMVEFYQTDQMLLVLIFQHAQEQGWLDILLTIQSSFAVDLATYAHGQGNCNLDEWAQPHINSMGLPAFARAIQDFLRTKMEDETAVQREHANPTTPRLTIKTVHLLLLLVNDALPDEDIGLFYRQCVGVYSRLFNYGDDETIDAIIDKNGEHGNSLPDETSGKMEEQYKAMYGGTTSPDALVKDLRRLKESEDPADQDLLAAMLHGLFDEYNCFGEYPNEALATTAVLFGGLVQFHILSPVAEQAALSMMFEAVDRWGPDDPMYRFGLQAMIHILSRLKEWPHLAEKILHTPSLQGTQAVTVAQTVLTELQQDVATNGDIVNGITNGALDDELPLDAPNPPFSGIHVDPPLRPDVYEDPNEEVSDKVMFALNNVSKRNLEEKFKDLESRLEERHHQWFAHYLVEELAKAQPNFQALYLQLLENFDSKILWQEVVRETYASCAKMLNAESTLTSTLDRNNLKHLASWLGCLTLARDQPILHRNLSFKDLLFEGQDTQRLIVAIPFTCKVLHHAKDSRVFKPPNPWLMELIHMLLELYYCFDLKLNLKFEIEVLCKDLNVELKEEDAADIIRSRRIIDNNMLQQYVGDGPDGFGDVHIMGLSKRAPNERFSPEAVIAAIPDLGNLLHIPQAAGNVTQPQLRTIFVNAAQRAVYEIIAPVVERSVTIAAISAAELIEKDFSTESDIDKLRGSAHTMVKSLSGSLALVTCKEPLRMSIMNNIRILAAHNLPEQLPEGQIIMFVNDNIDTVCSHVEKAAEEHSKAEIDAQLQKIIASRTAHMAERPNEPFNNPPMSRWAQLIPEPYKMDMNGLNRQQLRLYEDFGRQARVPPTQSSNSQSQDSERQIPALLTDGYLPSLTTPAETPAMPRQTPQQQRMMVGQGPHQQQTNGYMDTQDMGARIIGLMQELQAAAREAPQQHINEVGEGSPILHIFKQLIGMISSVGGANKEGFIVSAGQKCFYPIFDPGSKRLEIEVFARLVKHLCDMSPNAARQLSVQLALLEDDSIFNNAEVVVTLLAEDLFETQRVDNLVSKALRQKRPIVLTFLHNLLDEVLLGEKPIALRADFVCTYEALCQWLSEEPDLEQAGEILTKLRAPVTQANGVPSPAQTEKQDQHEYLFEEWITLQRNTTPERSFVAFVRQLHQSGALHDSDDSAHFFRACIEMSSTHFHRSVNQPHWGNQDTPYIHIDALAKLIAYMVVFKGDSEADETDDKPKAMDAIMRLVLLIMIDHHSKQREHWNGKIYFRLFSTLLCEIHGLRHSLGAGQEHELMKVFAQGLLVMQPRYFSGFTYAWLALIGHRLFVPQMLAGSGRSNGGWECYIKLTEVLFTTLGDLLKTEETGSLQEFYRGITRYLLMLHHDFPEFLMENHTQLNSAIPASCFQLHNIVNSAVTRAVIADQPDPFVAGLKINRLNTINVQPPLATSLHTTLILTEAGIYAAFDRSCASDPTDADIEHLTSTINALPAHNLPLILNVLTLALAFRATSTSSSFSAAQPPALLIARLLKESALTPSPRYHLIAAMLNQVRYVNAHTHYFATALQHSFTTSGDIELQQLIMRGISERLAVPRPHPWGVVVLILELLKGGSVLEMDWVKGQPELEGLLLQLVGRDRERGASVAAPVTSV